MQEIKKIKMEIKVREVTYVDKKTGETKKFLSYKGLTNKGWYDLRFTKDVENLPQQNGTLFVNPQDININVRTKYPTIWVKHFEKFEKINYEQNVEKYFEEI